VYSHEKQLTAMVFSAATFPYAYDFVLTTFLVSVIEKIKLGIKAPLYQPLIM